MVTYSVYLEHSVAHPDLERFGYLQKEESVDPVEEGQPLKRRPLPQMEVFKVANFPNDHMRTFFLGRIIDVLDEYALPMREDEQKINIMYAFPDNIDDLWESTLNETLEEFDTSRIEDRYVGPNSPLSDDDYDSGRESVLGRRSRAEFNANSGDEDRRVVPRIDLTQDDMIIDLTLPASSYTTTSTLQHPDARTNGGGFFNVRPTERILTRAERRRRGIESPQLARSRKRGYSSDDDFIVSDDEIEEYDSSELEDE